MALVVVAAGVVVATHEAIVAVAVGTVVVVVIAICSLRPMTDGTAPPLAGFVVVTEVLLDASVLTKITINIYNIN